MLRILHLHDDTSGTKAMHQAQLAPLQRAMNSISQLNQPLLTPASDVQSEFSMQCRLACASTPDGCMLAHFVPVGLAPRHDALEPRRHRAG